MFVIVAGGGRTGTQLASLLLAQEHVVHLIENRPEIFSDPAFVSARPHSNDFHGVSSLTNNRWPMSPASDSPQ